MDASPLTCTWYVVRGRCPGHCRPTRTRLMAMDFCMIPVCAYRPSFLLTCHGLAFHNYSFLPHSSSSHSSRRQSRSAPAPEIESFARRGLLVVAALVRVRDARRARRRVLVAAGHGWRAGVLTMPLAIHWRAARRETQGCHPHRGPLRLLWRRWEMLLAGRRRLTGLCRRCRCPAALRRRALLLLVDASSSLRQWRRRGASPSPAAGRQRTLRSPPLSSRQPQPPNLSAHRCCSCYLPSASPCSSSPPPPPRGCSRCATEASRPSSPPDTPPA